MNKIKKTLYTLNIDNYAPELTAITFPLMKKYADKIGAEFYVIDQRIITKDRPELPCVLEKLQIYNLGREHQNDWNLFFDADTMIHPQMYDPTSVVTKDITISGYSSDFIPVRFRPDEYFLRDGRMIGKGNWCGIASDWCLDYWHPLDDISYEEAFEHIYPTVDETTTVVTREHLIDDFIVSRNIARYGLKHILLTDVGKNFNHEPHYLAHQYLMPIEQKEVWMQKVLTEWKLA